MAVFHFVCVAGCGAPVQRILLVRSSEAKTWVTEHTCTCGAKLKRRASGPGCSVVERLDNGAMAKVVERPVGIAEMIRERNKKDGE